MKRFLSICVIVFLSSCQTNYFKKEKESIKINSLSKDANILLNNIKDSKCSKPSDVDLFLNNYNVNDISGFDETLLHIVTEYCSDFLFDKTLKQTFNIDQPTVFSKTPLAIALDIKSLYKIESLLKRGANINSLEFLDNPLFFIPIKQNNIKSLEILFQYDFNPYALGFMNQSWKDIKASNEIKKNMENYQLKYNEKVLLKNKEKRNFLINIIDAN